MDEEPEQLDALLHEKPNAPDRRELETQQAVRPGPGKKLSNAGGETESTQLTIALGDRQPLAEVTNDRPGVEIGATLGQGGMAIVRLGHQLKLDRAVAVKTLRPEFSTGSDVHRLLREARITGRLEHPNIVPVHDIVRGDDGTPQVVLKLIEGHTWSSLMDAPERVAELFGATDLLEWNLEVLMAVARALSFAHSRHILHRDIKPSNVMVGPFGEVYLLDWGIALDLKELEPDAVDSSGTTGYMAPEQLGAYESRLGTWTDTYLLGATLFRILSGLAPHADQPVEQRLMAVIVGRAAAPELPGDHPAELRQIVRLALAPDPTQRTQTAEALRLALASFLRHRTALRLVARGDEERAHAATASETEDEALWQRSTLAAEVSYRAALEDWPECEAARHGSLELASLRIVQALQTGDVPAAVRVLATHADLPDSLRQRVATAELRARDQQSQLRQIVSDADRGFGHRARGLLGAGFGLIWVGFWCSMAFKPPQTATPMIAFTVAVFALGFSVIAIWAREMLQNRINRTSTMVVAAALAGTIVWCVGASWLGLPMTTLLTGFLLMCALFASSMATLMDPWGAISAVGFAIAFLVAARDPQHMPFAMLGGNLVLIANQLLLNYLRGRRGFAELPSVGRRSRRT